MTGATDDDHAVLARLQADIAFETEQIADLRALIARIESLVARRLETAPRDDERAAIGFVGGLVGGALFCLALTSVFG
jgi:hypothetical protein